MTGNGGGMAHATIPPPEAPRDRCDASHSEARYDCAMSVLNMKAFAGLLFLVRLLIGAAVDFVGRYNLLYLRSAIARERGIGAYRAWVPFERIRPTNVSQREWEESFAWPTNNKPPYPPLAHRMLRGLFLYGAMLLIGAFLLQFFTPFPVLTWIVGWPTAKP